jgi:hypothetical protein
MGSAVDYQNSTHRATQTRLQVADRWTLDVGRGCQVKIRKAWLQTIVINVFVECHGHCTSKTSFEGVGKNSSGALYPLQQTKFVIPIQLFILV